MKVETHNHPTAIAPFPGAATGSGGEIRDEGATGCGAKPKAGLTGFTVSNLRIPDALNAWETQRELSPRIASALQIMIDGPIGAAAFNNEFGRPNILGYFRSFELALPGDAPGRVRGYHKPIMIAGGLGNIRRAHVEKREIPVGARIIVLGGPGDAYRPRRWRCLIALERREPGGSRLRLRAAWQPGDPAARPGSHRSLLGARRAQPDSLDSRCRCGRFVERGAGAIAHSHRGGRIDFRSIPTAEPGMSPLEVWCNEAQERYVLAVAADAVRAFEAICDARALPVRGDRRDHRRRPIDA